MSADGKGVLVMVRGDHQLSETKLLAVLGATELRQATPHEIAHWFGAQPGSLGPVGVKNMRVLADTALEGRRNMITGANKDDYHLRNVTPGEDFQPEYFDLRQVAGGDACVNCGQPLTVAKAIEIGHIFKLGYKYSESMGLRVLGNDGKEVTPIMGSYGIGIERILTCAIELFNDKDGMSLPAAIAPFTVVITPVNYAQPLQREAADLLYAECRKAGIDALLDDRNERPGVKFKDADLIGIPYRITIGKKLVDGKIEFVERRTRASAEVLLSGAIAQFAGKTGRLEVMAVDWSAARREFPSLVGRTYLNTATFGQLPVRSSEAVRAHFERRERTAATDFLDWFEDMQALRAALGRLLHAQASDVAFIPNASTALSLAISSIDWRPGDEMLTLHNEFPNQLYAHAGVGARSVECDWGELEAQVNERTRLVLLSTVNWATGLRPDLSAIVPALRRRGIVVLPGRHAEHWRAPV